jgi:hypothetical protein
MAEETTKNSGRLPVWVWDEENKRAIGNQLIPGTEMLPGTKLTPDGAPDDSLQDLAGKRGTDAAKRSLLGRYTNQKK